MQIYDTYLDDKNTYHFSGEPLIVQSEYFNIKLLKAIEELGNKIDLKQVLMVSAQVVSYSQFSRFFKNRRKMSVEDKKKVVESYFSHCGFGNLSMRSISNKGGYAELISEHYASAWLKYYGQRPANHPGVGYFTCGFLCGAIEAIFEVPSGTFDGKQSLCLSKGDPKSRFEIFRGLRRQLKPSPAMGKQQQEVSVTDSDTKVIDAIKSLHLSGTGHSSGFIQSFDATWTKQYVNYFSLILIKLFMQAERKLGKGGMAHIKKIFTVIAESNAYFILGKITSSDFWKEEISPALGKDPGSVWRAYLGLMTGLGYGKWELMEESSTEYKVHVVNNPETNAYLKLVGNTKAPLGYGTGGFLTGLAHYIRQNPQPASIDNDFVEQMKSSKQEIFYKEEQSRMVGADQEVLMVLVH